MNLTVEFRLYTRLYKGILENRLGRKGYGEIAPFPGFRSETYDQAFAFVNRLCYPIGKPHPPLIIEETIAGIPEHLTATRFGLGCALAQVSAPENSSSPSPSAADHPQAVLLPRGSQALAAWQPYWEAGYRTFKWKIGLADPALELKLLDQLLTALPPEAKLRLDANGNLTVAQAQEWLKACDPQRIEFLEQPLDPDQKEELIQLAQDSTIPLALDESVSTLADLQEWVPRWPGIFVIKVPLLGFVEETRSFLNAQGQPLDLVFSSVLETAIGRKTALELAQQFHNPKRAMGFGVQAWLDPNDGFEAVDPEKIWELLS
jgi:o-succinylbenzoate synthase